MNSDGECESRSTVTTAPFVRPCTVVKMFENNNEKDPIFSSRSASTTKSKSDVNKHEGELNNVNQTDIHGSQTNLDR